ncbi:MAG: acyl-ACP--UDP-N-acetylglucosamine O-acyltransferase [Pseudomonadota bacterium]|nr:acyl-ACP--UDP-N-acetylglucosamine O-acyltransferase [Pseudomonadota bacterium]
MHHPTALIDPKAKLDEGVDVGPYSVIGPQVSIGSGSVIESHVIVRGPTKLGKNNHVFQFSTVGDGSPDKKYKGEPTKLLIGDENVIREGVTIHRGTVQEKGITRIGDRNLLLAYTHVAHDCEIEDDVVLTNQAALAGAVKVGKGAILGGYAIVHQFCSIGAYSFCAMGSAVNKDIPAYVKVRGNPAKPHGINTVGLKRLGYSSKVIEALKSAYRSTYRKRLTVQEALEEIKPLAKKHKEVDLYYSTIKKATRGISR